MIVDGKYEALEKKAKLTLLAFKIAALSAVLIVLAVSFSVLNVGEPVLLPESENGEGDYYVIELPFDREMAFGTVDMEFKDTSGIDHYVTIVLTVKEENKNVLYCEYSDFEIDESTVKFYNLLALSADQLLGLTLFMTILLPLAIILSLIFAGTLTMGVKLYDYKGRRVMIYNGCITHRLYIDGKLKKVMYAVLPFFNKNFGTEYEYDVYQVKVSKTNRARLFVNGIEIKPGETVPPENDSFAA